MLRPFRRALLLCALLAVALPGSASAHFNITFVSGGTGSTGIDKSGASWVATADDAKIDVGELETALQSSDITISTNFAAGNGSQAGTVTLPPSLPISASAANNGININAGGDVMLASPVSIAGAVVVTTTGTTSISAGITARLFGVLGAGATVIDSADIATQPTAINNDQTYNGPVTLKGTTALSSSGTSPYVQFNSSVTLESAADVSIMVAGSGGTPRIQFGGAVDGAGTLSLNSANNNFYGAVGGTTPLTAITALGRLSTGSGATAVKTTGDQTYSGGLDLDANTTFTASGPGATVTVADHVSNAIPRVFTIDAANTTFQNGTVIGSAANPLKFVWVKHDLSNGADSITTSGLQMYDGAVSLKVDTSIASFNDSVYFLGTVDGAHSLNVTAALLVFEDSVGGTTALTSLSATTTNGYTTLSKLSGATIHTSGDQSYSSFQLVNHDQTVTSDSGAITVTGDVPLEGHTLTLNGRGSISGVVNDGVSTPAASALVLTGEGPWTMSGHSTHTGGTTVTATTLIVSATGTIGNVSLLDSTLAGKGTVGAVTAANSVVSPGTSPGKLTSGALSLSSTSTLQVELNGPSAGTGYDQLAVTGAVDVTGATLDLSASTFPHAGTVYKIVDNDSTDAVAGTFAAMPEGTVVDAGGGKLKLSYVGGDGNDVTLTAQQLTTSTTVSASPATPTEGSPVDLTATVTGPGSGAPTPGGTVTFRDGGTTLGSAALVNGAATVHLSSLSAGDHAITASYAGNADYLASTGSGVAHVNPKAATGGDDSGAAGTGTNGGGAGGGNNDGGGSGNNGGSGGDGGTTLPAISIANAKGTESDPPKKSKKGRAQKPAKPKTVVFVVTLSAKSAVPVTVRYTTKNGTAKAGKDLKRTTGTLTFKPGVTKLILRVAIVADNTKEKLERFTLILSRPAHATLKRAIATGSIKDDD